MVLYTISLPSEKKIKKTAKDFLLWWFLWLGIVLFFFHFVQTPSKSWNYYPYRISLNQAKEEELQLIPGIGAKRALSIKILRESRGGFKQLEELTEIKGMSFSLLTQITPYITLGSL